MRLERYFRPFHSSTPGKGYEVPQSYGGNRERGRLGLPLTCGTDVQDPFPEMIGLFCEIQTETFQSQTRAIYTDDTRTWPGIGLYDHPKINQLNHRSVSLFFGGCLELDGVVKQGARWDDMALIIPQEKYIHRKTFLFQSEREFRLRQQLGQQNDVTYTPSGQLNQYPLWAYGGYYQPGCRLEDVEQTVFTLSLNTAQSSPVARALIREISFWKKTPIVFDKWRVAFQAPLTPRHQLSLGDEITQGFVTCQFQMGCDERGTPWRQGYRSYQFEQKSSWGNLVLIRFKKED